MTRIMNSLIILWMAVGTVSSHPAHAASKAKIDEGVKTTLIEFYDKVSGGEDLLKQASGALVFPRVKKAGIGIGGEYGQGALLVGGETAAYYSTAAASIGFQLGAQVRREIILFMNDEALEKFRSSEGWEAGVDGSVALITVGAGGEIDITEMNQPIIGFIFSNKGLMYNLSLEGSKFTQIKD